MDNLVKQRVVGAVVLVALAVIFIPILLEGPDEATGPRSLDLPPALEEMREGRIESMEPVLVVPPDPVSTVVIGESGETTLPVDPVPPDAEIAAEQTAPVMDAQAVPAPVEAPRPAETVDTEAPPVPSAGGWAVQVGAFGQESNALAMRDRLRQAGYSAFVERVTVDARAVYRVRVGPFTERAAAEAQLQGLARDSGLQVRVMPHP